MSITKIFKNCASFTACTSTINNTNVHDTHDIALVMFMYSLIEYSDIYSETSEVYGKVMNQL